MKEYIHLGMVKEEVTELLGEPSTINNNLWTYGSSHIKFDSNGEVIAWKNVFDDLSKGMKPIKASGHTFFMGSTTQEVLQALGSPTAVIDDFKSVWRYEASHIKFDGTGRVIEWKNVFNQIDHGLQQPVEGADYLKIGASPDDVLCALGAPDSYLALSKDVWHYQASHVKFRNNQVIEWKNQFRQMDIGMKKPEESHVYLSIGITKEEVLTILGSPTEILAINPNVWKYASSHILFENEKVIEWKNVFNQLDGGLKEARYKDFIRLGLSTEEVADIYGSPSSILNLDPDCWHYQTSHIRFKNNYVSEWRNMFRDLEKGFKKGDSSEEDVKVGVSEDVVLRRLGSPYCILENEPLVWHYGNALVKFGSDRTVVSWQNIDDIKKQVNTR